ncbi:ATP-dependent DNA helicase PIF1-like protein [Tanacetum coccineum]
MRAQTDPWFSNFLLRVSDRVEEVIDEDYFQEQSYQLKMNTLITLMNCSLTDFLAKRRFTIVFDEAEDDTHNFHPLEFLNSFNVGGLPPHYLRLNIGCLFILLRNLDPENGLCNGTRLICKRFDPNVINVEIVVRQHVGVRVLLPRIPFALSKEDMFSFKLKSLCALVLR